MLEAGLDSTGEILDACFKKKERRSEHLDPNRLTRSTESYKKYIDIVGDTEVLNDC